MVRSVLLIILALICSLSRAQNNVGINTNTPDSSAVLHLESTDKGLLMPRLTAIQRNNINNPATGLVIYNTTDSLIEQYNGVCWVPSYSKNCADCSIHYTFQQTNFQLDRANNLNFQVPFNVSSSAQNNAYLSFIHDFSDETELNLNLDSLNSSGDVSLDITTNVFENGGIHYVTFFAGCGESLVPQTISIDLSICDELIIDSSKVDYDLSSQGLSGNNCVRVIINENVGIRSTDNTTPGFTTGGLSGVNLGILNNGYIFGRGGDGPLQMGVNGADGGTALELTTNTEIRNNGMIYGGGGSGLTVGTLESVDLGVFQFCLALGAGGGGGMPDGQGGGDTQGSCAIVLGIWEMGNNADSLYDDNEGFAVSEETSISIPTPVVSGTIEVALNSGGGGDFGEDGSSHPQPVDFTGSELNVTINIPFVGDVTIPIPLGPILNPIANTINTQFNNAVPGSGGYAIQHGGNTINIPDGDYQTFRVRGKIGN